MWLYCGEYVSFVDIFAGCRSECIEIYGAESADRNLNFTVGMDLLGVTPSTGQGGLV